VYLIANMTGWSRRDATRSSIQHVAAALAVVAMLCAGGCKDRTPKVVGADPSAIAPAVGDAGEPAAARQLAAWLTAFNTGDRTTLVAYHERAFPYAGASQDLGDVERELGLSQATGGFELARSEASTPTTIAALLKERGSDQFARVTMEVAPEEPHQVTHFTIHPVATPEELRTKRLSEPEALAALRAELATQVANDRFAGAVLVARNGEPIFAEAYGLADRDKKLANKLDTRFRIGSMNKMFTAVATLMLVQAGTLAVTDPLGKIVHDYPNKTVASKVTLHHLLTHTGGTGDIFGPEFDAHRRELRTLSDYVKLYGKRDLAFQPGATWDYSNYGYVLLGVVIEHAAGKSYYDWVNDHVFVPSGMVATGSPPEDHPVPGLAVGYTRREPTAAWAPNTEALPYRGTSAGGGSSTVTDLLRFAKAVTGHKLLDAKHTDLLTTGRTQTTSGGMYGYGFSDDSGDGVRCFGHGGGAPGMNGDLEICESGYTIVVLSNLDPPAGTRIADFIRHRLPAKAP
jgi:D-alanyl-D-alanine carboxypeptidase